jgi:NAD+ diphosphatase
VGGPRRKPAGAGAGHVSPPFSPALSRGTVDRVAERRTDGAWLDAAWDSRTSRVLLVCDGQVRVRDDDSWLHLIPTSEAPSEAPRYLLGIDDAGAYFAVPVDELPLDPGTRVAGLREIGAGLPDRDTGLLVHAIGLDNWHRTHTHCARCGAPTDVGAAGHVRVCPDDGSQHFPRTDPAVIMAVISPDDRLLLGHQHVWPARRYSTLAGFVEPGESLEMAVAREVREEAGVDVVDVTYIASQPWPFPSSLMLGFTARAVAVDVRPDGEEIEDLRWFARDALRDAVASGDVRLPPPVSIARRLIELWYGGSLGDDARW